MPGAERITVDVVYALVAKQYRIRVDLPAGSTLRQAIEASGMPGCLPAIDLEVNKVGIFGALRRPDDLLSDGDRVEIYRPLVADPKEARRRRAAKRRTRS